MLQIATPAIDGLMGKAQARIVAAGYPGRQTQGRLSLTTGVPVTSADVASSGTVRFVPIGGMGVITRYDGEKLVNELFSEMSLPLDSNAGHTDYHAGACNFDVWYYDDGGTRRIGTGAAWSGTTRGIAIENYLGIPVNQAAINARWGTGSSDRTLNIPARMARLIGTIRTISDGLTCDTARRRFVSSVTDAYRPFYVLDAAGSWTYATASFREHNNNASNRLEMVLCTAKNVWARYVASFTNSGATARICYAGIGVDSVSVSSALQSGLGYASSAWYAHPFAEWQGELVAGYHYLTGLEKAAGADTQTFHSSSGDVKAPFFGGLNG